MIEVTAAIIKRDNRILICQRPEGKSCGLLWEFPGGKVEYGETGEQCIIREIQEELGITLRVIRKLTDVTFEYPDKAVHLNFYITEIESGNLICKEHNALAWISLTDIKNYHFCPADSLMLEKTDLTAIF